MLGRDEPIRGTVMEKKNCISKVRLPKVMGAELSARLEGLPKGMCAPRMLFWSWVDFT